MIATFTETAFDLVATKIVSKTDKSKSAYVLTKQQVELLNDLDTQPGTGELSIPVLFDATKENVRASYYHAKRSEEAERQPEPRMGKEFIASWLSIGDEVAFAALNGLLVVFKSTSAPENFDSAAEQISRTKPETALRDLAAQARKNPPRKKVTGNEYVRNPFVVAAALARANDKCEMPNCDRGLITKVDGTKYLEVHHVIGLAEGGDDSLENVAALCPHCHRAQHHSANKIELRELLEATIRQVEEELTQQ